MKSEPVSELARVATVLGNLGYPDSAGSVQRGIDQIEALTAERDEAMRMADHWKERTRLCSAALEQAEAEATRLRADNERLEKIAQQIERWRIEQRERADTLVGQLEEAKEGLREIKWRNDEGHKAHIAALVDGLLSKLEGNR